MAKHKMENQHCLTTRLFHPFLFSIFPILSVYAANFGKLPLSETFSPVLLILITTSVLWGLINYFIKDVDKSAIITSILVFYLLSYGHIILIIKFLILFLDEFIPVNIQVKDFFLISDTGGIIIIIILSSLLSHIILRIYKTGRNLENLNQGFNLMAIASLVFFMFQIFNVGADILPTKTPQFVTTWQDAMEKESLALNINPATENPPDIYYIILDGYGSSEILSSMYAVDNSQFYEFLESKGFYIAHEATSNYNQTDLSLASSLNFTYLDNLSIEVLDQNNKLIPSAMVKDNRIFHYLKSLGYQTVTFSHVFTRVEIDNSDFFLSSEGNLSEFQQILISNSIIPFIFFDLQYNSHRGQILNTFENLPVVDDPGMPQIIMAHLIAPHPPFVFDAQGLPIRPNRPFRIDDGSDFLAHGTKDEYIQGYRNQLLYINQQMETVINRILADGEQAPIIIIQGDHGPGSEMDWENVETSNARERMSILNAYYFPDQNYENLYPKITPVNTFRVILNQFFGASLEYLPDKNFMSDHLRPYNFQDVTDQVHSFPMNQR